jgi:hypothetical protein
MDGAYTAKYLSVARMLWNASEGNPSDIPEHYAAHLNHEYADGDVSLVSLLPKFEYTEGLEQEEIEEAIEILGKVNPQDWPFTEDIIGIDVEQLLKVYDEDASSIEFDFVEDNLSTANKVEKVLREVISSVFGERVNNIRNNRGQLPSSSNNFLMQEDGTYAGTFQYDRKTFDFEIAPTESGWLCTYRLDADSFDKLPPKTEKKEAENDKNKRRSVRSRGW